MILVKLDHLRRSVLGLAMEQAQLEQIAVTKFIMDMNCIRYL